MAVEDGKMQEFTAEMFAGLIKSRRTGFSDMMERLPEQGYTLVPLREEAGVTARLAIHKVHEEKRGIFIICPGGGFIFKSANEAEPVADFFFDYGINVAILDYHVDTAEIPQGMASPKYVKMAGEDALAAIRYLRLHAEELGILGDHIAVGGFSAGGMTSGYAATKFDYGNPEAEEELMRVSSRPDAALILYGAFSTTSMIPSGPGGLTREQIMEANETDTVRNIRTDCPAMYVFQTHGDDPRIALNFCMELAVHGVPYEIHTFEDGPHGGGLYNGKDDTPDIPHTALWAPIAADWLIHKGY